ncbi:MAG: PAS domain-containing protein [Roseiflexaceae bacterium]|nr:PAS domain-containing protein [Roseiflexaceae bacterium]
MFAARILEQIPSSLLVINQQERVVAANRNFYQKSRRTAETTLGRTLDQVFPKVLITYTQLAGKVRALLHDGQPHEGGKLTYRAPGLPQRIYYYRLIPLQGDDGAPYVLLFMDDITAQEQFQAEARQVEQRLARVVECANDLVISLDPGGQIVTWNHAAECVCGISAVQAHGRTLTAMCDDASRLALAHLLAGCAADPRSQDAVRHAEASLLTADGRCVPIAWSCSPMHDEAGRVVGIVALGRDLTERRRMEAQLIQSAKMASLGVMAGGVAHELRNPLGIISACVQLLDEASDDPVLRSECAERIYTATRRAAQIIENLLTFASPQYEQMAAVELGQVLDAALLLLRHRLLAQQINLTISAAPDLPLVLGNTALLQQVFVNLVLNACEAMPDGGALTLALDHSGVGQVRVRVIDSGCGIAPEHLARVFDPFFTTRPIGKGIGLGLSLCYSIVQQHHGVLTVESQVGQGSSFTLLLPATLRDRDA